MNIYSGTIAAGASVDLTSANGLPGSGTLSVLTDGAAEFRAYNAATGERILIHSRKSGPASSVPFAGDGLRITAGDTAVDVTVSVVR